MNKITPHLNDYLNNNPSSATVEVVIELSPVDTTPTQSSDAPRNEKIAQLKDAFQKNLGPVQQAIQSAGGNVTDSAWLNSTVKAVIPAANIHALANLEAITAIDLPRTLSSE